MYNDVCMCVCVNANLKRFIEYITHTHIYIFVVIFRTKSSQDNEFQIYFR